MFTSHVSRPRGERRAVAPLVCALIIALAVLTSSCGDDFFGPQILDMQVTPSEMPENEAAYTNPEVTITVSGFTGEITEADAFLQENDRVAPKQDFRVSGNTITLEGIRNGWFEGLAPGTYEIGASVISDAGEDIEQSNLATVTLTDN